MPGTIMYMAPESILHRKSLAASDTINVKNMIFGLWRTLLEMLIESDIPTGGDHLEFLTQIT